jgi:hypothetical protein
MASSRLWQSNDPFPWTGLWSPNELPDRQKHEQLIYREARQGMRAKSVALRREDDWDTGLSFTSRPPQARLYLVYRIIILEGFSFTVEFDGGQAIVGRRTGTPFLTQDDQPRFYSARHTSIYRQDLTWDAWYKAEQDNFGQPTTSFYSEAFFFLREEDLDKG